MKHDLKQTWVKKELSKIILINPRITNKNFIEDELEVQFLPMKLIEEKNNKIHLIDSRKYREVKKGSYTTFINGDILFAKVTPCMENGKIAIVDQLINGIGFGSSEYHVLRCGPEILNKFLYYFISQDKFRSEAQDAMTGAVGLRRVPKQFLENYEVIFPSTDTQRKIVDKIEELFSELDKGIEYLRLAQQQLKTYRQAVLKWAFEGRLTNENVKKGELPKGWKIVKLKEVAKEISDGDHQAPPKSNTGVPFITISNINKGTKKIDFSYTFSVSIEYYSNLKINRKPIKGDVLYTVTGSYGIPILIDFDKKFCFQRHIGLVRPLDKIDQKWLFYLLQSPDVFNQAKLKATGTAQKTVALSSLRNFEIPYSEIKEQQKIVLEIEKRLSVTDKMQESIEQSLLKIENLRQSILRIAFNGSLQ